MLKEGLSKLFKLDEYEKVLYKDLSSVPYGVWINLHTEEQTTNEAEISPGAWYKHLKTKAYNQELFLTRIYNDYGYHYHAHDCKETVTPLNGALLINDIRVVNKYEVVTFYAGTKHKVFTYESDNRNYTDALVEFNRV